MSDKWVIIDIVQTNDKQSNLYITTFAREIDGVGCIVRNNTLVELFPNTQKHLSESMVFIPGVCIKEDVDEEKKKIIRLIPIEVKND